MKTFRLFGIIMMLVVGLSFTSCEDDERPLTGEWVGYVGDEVIHMCFYSNGSGYCYENDHDPDYFTDYMVSEGTLLIRWEGDEDYDFEGYIEDITSKSFKVQYDDEWITLYKR